MSREGGFKFERLAIPKFETLIVSCCEEGTAIFKKFHSSDWSSMSLEYFRFDTATGIPETDSVVERSACYNVRIGGEGDSCGFFGVSIESHISFGIGYVP